MKTGEIIMYHTEGFIKEITVKDDAPITFTLIPTEAFAFGRNESDGKKMILIKEKRKTAKSEERLLDAKLVAQSVEFKICKGNSGGHETDNDEHGKKEPDGKEVLVNLLYALKKDRAQVRVAVEHVFETVYQATSITIL